MAQSHPMRATTGYVIIAKRTHHVTSELTDSPGSEGSGGGKRCRGQSPPRPPRTHRRGGTEPRSIAGNPPCNNIVLPSRKSRQSPSFCCILKRKEREGIRRCALDFRQTHLQICVKANASKR